MHRDRIRPSSVLFTACLKLAIETAMAVASNLDERTMIGPSGFIDMTVRVCPVRPALTDSFTAAPDEQ
jgi:hypothetical protein